YLVRVKNLREGAELIERIAPEHVSLVCQGAAALAGKLRNSGCIFVGEHSPVAAGDYAAGPSHTLPTGGAGKSFGGLRLEHVFRRTSVVQYERASLAKIRSTVETLAGVEGMGAHRASVAIRFADKAARHKGRK
ncbi:MAG: histidinol dehydrogenase, partial [Bdellovibrionaceae bacterium]|nr:histidinol dehydrogenase [Pseudobdellovibrionaceae bacterium]